MNRSPCWISSYTLDIKGHEEAKFYLFFGAAVAADGPQVPDGSPQQDDEEAAEERDHG